MREENIPRAQGDLLVVRLDSCKNGKAVFAGRNATLGDEIRPLEGRLVVGHSETGHHHTVPGMPNIAQLFGTSDPDVRMLRILEPTQLRHDRPLHRHEALGLEIGEYAIIRQRERRPQGWVAVVD